jgi:hypothetical protein
MNQDPTGCIRQTRGKETSFSKWHTHELVAEITDSTVHMEIDAGDVARPVLIDLAF